MEKYYLKIIYKLIEKMLKDKEYEYEGDGFYYCSVIKDTCPISDTYMVDEVCKRCLIEKAVKEVEEDAKK